MSARKFGVLVVTVALIGCGQSGPSGSGTGKGDTGAAPAPAEVKPAFAARVQMDTPAGWVGQRHAAWSLYEAADKLSYVAHTEMGAGESVQDKVREVAGAAGATELRFSGEQDIGLGPDKLPARAAPGACRLGGREATFQYAVADVGDDQRVVVAFFLAKDATEAEARATMGSIASLRRK